MISGIWTENAGWLELHTSSFCLLFNTPEFRSPRRDRLVLQIWLVPLVVRLHRRGKPKLARFLHQAVSPCVLSYLRLYSATLSPRAVYAQLSLLA